MISELLISIQLMCKAFNYSHLHCDLIKIEIDQNQFSFCFQTVTTKIYTVRSVGFQFIMI